MALKQLSSNLPLQFWMSSSSSSSFLLWLCLAGCLPSVLSWGSDVFVVKRVTSRQMSFLLNTYNHDLMQCDFWVKALLGQQVEEFSTKLLHLHANVNAAYAKEVCKFLSYTATDPRYLIASYSGIGDTCVRTGRGHSWCHSTTYFTSKGIVTDYSSNCTVHSTTTHLRDRLKDQETFSGALTEGYAVAKHVFASLNAQLGTICMHMRTLSKDIDWSESTHTNSNFNFTPTCKFAAWNGTMQYLPHFYAQYLAAHPAIACMASLTLVLMVLVTFASYIPTI